MRILIVCSGNAENFDFKKHQAFIYDQVEAVRQIDPAIAFDYFFVTKKGIYGYLSCLSDLINQLRGNRYHCIHAHVALSALLSNLQRQVPVVATFHGSDINFPSLRMVSLIVELLSRKTIYISAQLISKAIYANKSKRAVIPCGVDFDVFIPRSKEQSRRQLGLSAYKKYILFSSRSGIAVKNYPLARAAVALLQDKTVELIELKNYTREEVALLFTAVDVALMTSHSEGSPQFVKEALACNCPVVSTNVGDVQVVMGNIAGCYITSYDATDVADKIRKALANTEPVLSRESIRQFDNRLIAQQIREVYCQIQ
ncbi:glycosyltransferase [Larkinella punicea]|uniref:Glycosyltransferase n=1 Tax=Larkinella punicea TaxID=2315727 RepID=A0A368JM34_9BACT|nr:glycosyltransferase [Larkinella punicea]RCR67613.1 glycosyltransferase [Larkinella punicea]